MDTENRITFNKPALYVPVGIRGEVLSRVHSEAGHPAANKSYAIIKRFFYWPGLYSDVRRLQQYCLQCRLHTPKKSKAKMAGHLQATAAGQVWVLDLLHLTEAEDGCHLAVCMVDVFSRYAVVEKLSAATSTQVKLAFQDRIMTICSPHKVITDGGSEFKGHFSAAMKELGIEHHVTTPHHSEGHGMVERFNRTVSRGLSKMMLAQGKDQWIHHLGAAMVAYNCTPHTAHKLPPMQVFYNTVESALLPATLDCEAELENKRSSALELVLSRQAMKQVVTKRLEAYNKSMEQSRAEDGRFTRTLSVGATVLIYRDLGGRLKNKWNDRFDGPFVVTMVEEFNKYTVQRIGSDDPPQSEHIDNLVNAPILPAAVDLHGLKLAPALESNEVSNEEAAAITPPPLKAPALKALKPKKQKKYEVEYIAGKIDDKFLIKWKGYDAATWEPITNLDCSKLIKDFHRLSNREKDKLREKTLAAAPEHTALSQLCSIHSTATFISKDLAECANGEIIEEICRELEISLFQVLLIWASPDCRTYSRADASNISRGNEYRDHSDPFRPPKAIFDDKRFEAIKQDALVASVLKSFLKTIKFDMGANLIMENPAGSLRLRPFVWIYEMIIGLTRHTIDYCAFGSDRRKTTDFWCTFPWDPAGDTGNGRCQRKCKAGSWVDTDGVSSYRHPVVVGGNNDRRPTGHYAKSQIPLRLYQDIIQAAAHRAHKEGTLDDRKVIIELFAGSTSLGTVARQAGFDYVAVDISKLSEKSFQRLHCDDTDLMQDYFDIGVASPC